MEIIFLLRRGCGQYGLCGGAFPVDINAFKHKMKSLGTFRGIYPEIAEGRQRDEGSKEEMGFQFVYKLFPIATIYEWTQTR